MKIKLLILSLLFSLIGWGQANLPVNRTTWNAGAPLGWTDGNAATPSYSTPTACNTTAGRLDNSTEFYQVFFDVAPSSLSYSIRLTAAAPTSSLLVEESSNGTVWTTIVNHTGISGTTCTVFNQTLLATSRYVKWTYTKVTQNLVIDDVNITALGGTPTITVLPTSLTGFTYVVGSGPSTNQTFTASGVNLTGNLILTAPANYEIATAAAGPFSGSVSLTPTAGTVAATTIYVRLKAGLSVGSYNLENVVASSAGATSQNVACSGTVTGSNNSDVIAVAASESATISSIINNPAPLTSGTGVQVWQFKVRDGGATLSDTDNLPTILTDFTLAQAGGNQVGTWTDAINTIELFDGATRLAAATVTATQIQFTGLNVSVADNTEKILSLRMSLKCPLGADAFDGEDFMFSLSNTNVTFSTTGSGKTAFAAQTSTNGQNVIDVVATRLAFTTQPVTTGVNSSMGNVVVSATDACGNIDTGFTGSLVLTSTGTMTGAPINGTAVAGVTTFSGIIHTVIGTGFTLNASSLGLLSATSSLFDILNITTLLRGDLAILAVNTNLASNPGNDQIAFVCFQDLLPGTKIYLTDNGYERQFANEWGGTEGVISITRTGSTLPKGTIIVIEGNVASGNIDAPSEFDVYTCGAIDANWTKTAISGGSIGGFNLNSNDDVWIMQGGNWTNSITHHSTYDGNVLYGWTESGWDATPGGASQSTQWSTIFPTLECYNTVAPVGGGKVKFNDPVNPDFSTITNGKLDWIALINNFANWDTYATDALYNAGGYDYKGNASCPQMTIANVGYVNGKWTGRVDTNWFNCGNWDTLVVPDATVDVQVGDNVYNNQAIVDATAPQSDYYSDLAQARNLTITGEKVEVTAANTNILEVHGNLLIDAPAGALDMNAGGATDGLLRVYGNWTNNMGNAAFDEGNGTVIFTGTAPQVISNVAPEGTETFRNLILNNDFNTSVSNDIIATNDVTVNATKTLTITNGRYAQVNNILTNSGTVDVQNNGSLVQVNNVADVGSIFVKRDASQRISDYVYWSSPVQAFNLNYFNTTGGTNYIYRWDPVAINANGGEGNWIAASGNMTQAKGYIVRGNNAFNNTAPTTWTANFTGLPNNGNITIPIQRGNDYTTPGTQGIPRTANDDNWNLVGNPYPSALGVNEFLDANADINGFVKIWTHTQLPTSPVDPFYQDFGSNYYTSDYTTINKTGITSGPGDYKIGAGQGFFVLMNAGAPASSTVTFTNSMRSRTFANNQFFRMSTPAASKSRIWLDLITNANTQQVTRTLVGFIDEATFEKDRMFDAVTNYKTAQNFYSLINDEPMIIQGRPSFDVNDKVPMGVKIPADGSYTIAIATVDGLFTNGRQKIYLEDKYLNTVYDLTSSPYEFTASQGIVNDRFVLRFTGQALSSNDFVLENNVSVYGVDNAINVKSSSENIKNVIVYNVLGQVLVSKDASNNSVEINGIMKTNQALVVKITLENGQVLSKKLVH